MKYISAAQIKESISQLGQHHSFFGTSFLAMKEHRAPVGSTAQFSLDQANREFLKRYYQVHPRSKHFFLPFKRSSQYADWVKPAYASTTLQRINTSTFASALLHTRGGADWGWSTDYVGRLHEQLFKSMKVPLFHLAAWILREAEWEDSVTRPAIVAKFRQLFCISEQEGAELFESTVTTGLSEEAAFQPLPAKWQQILEGFAQPPDVPPENSGTLQLLEFTNIGPIKSLRFNPAQRLNLITGDNGLGKTFLLDLVWWALTREWADNPVVPFEADRGDAKVSFLVANSSQTRPVTAEFDKSTYQWKLPRQLPALSGLVVYARVDGSFAVWDPANVVLAGTAGAGQRLSVVFRREDVWNGKEPQIEGLIRDWVKWQGQPTKYPAFDTFQRVLKRVGPPDLGEISIGDPVRLRGEKKDIPTLKHPYGVVPIIYESAGIRRIVTLAYLIVWAWEEHRIQAKQVGKKEERQMVIILDEAEAHLHPKWQRVLLQALLGIASDLHSELSIQFFISTHSPLVLASAEPLFDAEKDKLFHLEMPTPASIKFTDVPYVIQGSSDAWLQSNVFGLGFAGSTDRESALRSAEALMAREDVSGDEVEAATRLLSDNVEPENPIWMRWVLFAAQHGVDV